MLNAYNELHLFKNALYVVNNSYGLITNRVKIEIQKYHLWMAEPFWLWPNEPIVVSAHDNSLTL